MRTMKVKRMGDWEELGARAACNLRFDGVGFPV